MNLEVKDLVAKIKPILQKARNYLGFALFLIVLGIFGFIVNQIRVYATVEPSDEAVTETLQGISTSTIDEETVKTIQELESTNVDVKALFDEARDNPFQE